MTEPTSRDAAAARGARGFDAPGAGRVGSPPTYRFRVWEYLIRSWRPNLWSGLGHDLGAPVVFLLALGLGLGSLINRNGSGPLGVSYAQYIAPALLTAAAFNSAIAESTFALFARFRWTRTLWGITSTPVTPGAAADGHALFVATRVTVSSSLYLLILLAFGLVPGPATILVVPIAVLCAVGSALWVMTLSAWIDEQGAFAFNILMRFVVLPMTLFSASFFPITQLPWAVRWLAFLSPLWHANELARAAMFGGPAPGQLWVHLLVLVLLLATGYVAVRRAFVRRLVE